MPNRVPSEFDRTPVCRKTHQAVIQAVNTKSRGNKLAVGGLKRIDNLELQIRNLRGEVTDPLLESIATDNVPAARCKDKVFRYKIVDRVDVFRCLPDRFPKIFYERD